MIRNDAPENARFKLLSREYAQGHVTISEAARLLGRPTINPRNFAYEELLRCLLRLSEPEGEPRRRVEDLRRRPRRTGKPL